MVKANISHCFNKLISVGTSSGAPQAGAKTSQDFISA